MIKKVANFGGVGGQYAPYSPGGSPTFRGGPSGYAGYGVNDFSADLSLDTIMARTNKPLLYGFERSIESMLESFHEDLESDIAPYLLTFEERLKLDLKKKIRNKEQYLKELKNPKVTKEDKIKEKTETIEDLLENFRKNTNANFSKGANTKISDSYFRRKTSPPLLDEFLPTIEEYDDEGNPLNLTKNILTNPFTGIVPQYMQEDGIDKYLKDLTSDNFPDMHSNFPALMNYDNEDQIGYHNAPKPLFDTPSTITPESKDNNQTLESKLEKLKSSNGLGRLDPNMFKGLDWDEKMKGTYQERYLTNQTPYEMDGYGTLKNDYLGGNNPYNSAGGLLRG
jgi:hypothetical protein